MQKQNWVACLMRLLVQIPLYLLERLLDAVDFVQDGLLARVFEREYERRGACERSGECCRAIGLEVPGFWFRFPRLIALVRKWHFLRYNFVPQGRQGHMLVYSCDYLTPQNTCGIHRFKPKLCRDYPQRPWRGFTRVHKGCGYYFEKRGHPDSAA